jgi:hypothetical protein
MNTQFILILSLIGLSTYPAKEKQLAIPEFFAAITRSTRRPLARFPRLGKPRRIKDTEATLVQSGNSPHQQLKPAPKKPTTFSYQSWAIKPMPCHICKQTKGHNQSKHSEYLRLNFR